MDKLNKQFYDKYHAKITKKNYQYIVSRVLLIKKKHTFAKFYKFKILLMKKTLDRINKLENNDKLQKLTQEDERLIKGGVLVMQYVMAELRGRLTWLEYLPSEPHPRYLQGG